MDWFICGNFASISCTTWLAFWSGAIGALVAAFVGGLVALMVVRLTNKHQSKLATRGRIIAAISDYNAALLAIPRSNSESLETVRSSVSAAESASTRLIMEMDDHELAIELSQWPYLLGSSAARVHKLRQGGDEGRLSHLGEDVLFKAAREVTDMTRMWARTSDEEAVKWTAHLTELRTDFVAAMELFRAGAA